MKKGSNVLILKLALLVFVLVLLIHPIRAQETSLGVFGGQVDPGTGVKPGAGSYVFQAGVFRAGQALISRHTASSSVSKTLLLSAFISNIQ